jgi:hypothetical protein
MKVPKACVKLCQKQYNAKEMKLFRQLINEEYRVHWYVPEVLRNIGLPCRLLRIWPHPTRFLPPP